MHVFLWYLDIPSNGRWFWNSIQMIDWIILLTVPFTSAPRIDRWWNSIHLWRKSESSSYLVSRIWPHPPQRLETELFWGFYFYFFYFSKIVFKRHVKNRLWLCVIQGTSHGEFKNMILIWTNINWTKIEPDLTNSFEIMKLSKKHLYWAINK